MREWFKAFHDQNDTVRDFKKYFRPNLCYLEGAWTLNTKTLNEPFQSDRHHIDATSWFDLQEKVRSKNIVFNAATTFAVIPIISYGLGENQTICIVYASKKRLVKHWRVYSHIHIYALVYPWFSLLPRFASHRTEVPRATWKISPICPP